MLILASVIVAMAVAVGNYCVDFDGNEGNKGVE